MKTTTALFAAAATPAAVVATTAGTNDTSKPYVTPESLQALIKLEDLLAGSQKLQDIADAHGGGHNATVDWLYDTLSATGYFDVVKQPFVELFSAGSANLSSSSGSSKKEYAPETLTYTAGTGGQILSRPVVAVANVGCEAADYPAGVADGIALVKRGTCDFSKKASLAKAAGAAAAVVYNNVAGPVAGTLGSQSEANAPIVGIPQDEGEAILSALASSPDKPLLLDLFIESIVENRTNYNVIAETKQGDKDNVLVLGGHSDSVYEGPGINDDGSGSVGVWAVARALAQFQIKNAVRFAFWGAEEFGKLGSFYYVKQLNRTGEAEIGKIRAYLNFDMIASPNYVYGIYDGDGSAFNFSGPAGSDQIERDFEDFFKANGLPSVPSVFSGRSDYAGFIENGIPSGGLFTGAEVLKTPEEAALFGGEAGAPLDANYHQAGDTIDNLARDAFLVNSKAIANSVAKYAMSWSSLPAVQLPQRRWSADRHQALHQAAARDDVAGHGHGHAHAHAHAGACGDVGELM
ncbi:Zn-dependent exopeptidase [Apiospora marii]|uniref:Peptide hydrolase n=1 Tax=Apiospora marii TaxID=335849 RepID=A0ABR1R0C8_9PEZI